MNNIITSTISKGWNAIPLPDQMKRVLIIMVTVTGGYFVIRQPFIPETFYETGHYRRAAVDSIRTLPISYAGEALCVQCHFDIGEVKQESRHLGVGCEVCHGPGIRHAEEDPTEFILTRPEERGFCPLCHGYNISRPTGFPQIDPKTHNPAEPCMSCHDPHDPVPPHTPEECSACHGSIARTKAISHHAAVPCVRCHEAPEEHRISPRTHLPSKPLNRAFCGECHDEIAESDARIPRIDTAEHESGYLCWQCHYPHYPEK